MNGNTNKRTATIILGEILHSQFLVQQVKSIELDKMLELGKRENIQPRNLVQLLRLEFRDQLVHPKAGPYSLRPDYTQEQFLEVLNIQRKKNDLEPLLMPKPKTAERE